MKLSKKAIFALIVIIILIFFAIFIFIKKQKYHAPSTSSITSKQNLTTKNIISKYKTYSQGEYVFSLSHQKMKRFYKIYIPSGYNPKKSTPLVIVFHGGGGNMEKSSQYFKFNQKAEKENFLVVYPEGTGVRIGENLLGTWNGGDCCGPAKENNIDDVGFIKKMLTNIKNTFNINDKMIFSTGMSNGAIMTYRLACELSKEIAAVAPVASVGHYQNCHPERPVPILHIHGLNDPCAPYNGCQECKSCIQTYLKALGIKTKNNNSSAMSVPKYIERWRKTNKCSDKTKTIYKKGGATCKKYLNCLDNADIILCTVKNMGHVWPGKAEYGSTSCQQKPNGKLCSLWKKIVGKTSTDISANDMIWDFFKKHPLE